MPISSAAQPAAAATKTATHRRVLMLLENCTYRRDPRVRQEAEALATAGHRVTVISPHPNDKTTPMREEISGVTVRYFAAPPEGEGVRAYLLEYGYATAIMAWHTLAVWLRDGFDVLHAHNPPDTFFWLGALVRVFGKQFVFDSHDSPPDMYLARQAASPKNAKPNPLLFRLLSWLEAWSCRAANRVICVNESDKVMLMERTQLPAQRFTVVRNGPNPQVFKPQPQDPTVRQIAPLLLGYVGLISPQDGVDYLVRAMKHLVQDLGRNEVRCVVIGDGPALAGVQQLTRELHLQDHLLFVGRQPREEVVRWLANVDVCVAPDPSNSYSDRATLIKVMEYMALGKPTVAFDLPENRISAGESAVYAKANDEMDFAQCLSSLLNDAPRREAMGRLGRERIETTLGWHQQSQHLVALYNGLNR